MPSRARVQLKAMIDHFLSFGIEGMSRQDRALIRRTRAFGLVLCLFLPIGGISAAVVFHRWSLLAVSFGALGLVALSLRYGYLGGARAVRLIVHATLAVLLSSTTLLALKIGNGSALSVTYPSVLILATCYLLGVRATIGWTIAAIACLAYVVLGGGPPPAPPGTVAVDSVDVFVSRSLVLIWICTLSVVERRFSDRAGAELEFLARHDPLTGLLNRRALEERLVQALARCRRYERQFAVLFIDLDGFKLVNDRFGHIRGDALLREIADRIRSVTRETDAASRIGGDEFTVVIEDYAEPKSVGIYARRLLTLLSQEIELDGVLIDSGASIGVACYPKDATDLEDLVRAADRAMYHAKASGGRCVSSSSELEDDDGEMAAPVGAAVLSVT